MHLRLLLLSLAIFVGSASADPPGSVEASAVKDPIRIGAILILSGLGAEQGLNTQGGALLAQAQLNRAGGINGRKLEILFEDEVGPNPKGAVTAYKKLTTVDRVNYIIGPQWLNEVQAVEPLAVKDGVFLILPSTCAPKLAETTFCLWADPAAEAAEFAKYVFARHKTAVVFGSTEPWETVTMRSFEQAYQKLGGKVLKSLWINETASDVKTEAVLTAQARPEAVFSSALIHFVSYRQELLRQRVQAPFYTVELFQELINAAAAAAEGIEYVTPALPDQKFRAAFQAAMKREPDIPAAQAYDAVMMLAQALRENGEGLDGMRRWFKSFGEYHGASGVIRIKDGKVAVPTAIYRVEHGRSREIQRNH